MNTRGVALLVRGARPSIGGATTGKVLHWVGEEPTPYLHFAFDVDPDVIAAPSLGYRPVGEERRVARRALSEGTIFVVANNVIPGGEHEFDSWYEDVHIPHTFEHFGFTAARRFAAVDTAAMFQRLIVYASPDDIAEVRAAIQWAANDRAKAEREGRLPALPVSETLVGPRHAGFYRLRTQRNGSVDPIGSDPARYELKLLD